jgi:hypothetical protein
MVYPWSSLASDLLVADRDSVSARAEERVSRFEVAVQHDVGSGTDAGYSLTPAVNLGTNPAGTGIWDLETKPAAG